MKVFQSFAVIGLVVLLSACASRPPARSELTQLPALGATNSRIYISAGTTSGVKLWSVAQVGPVSINGKPVGQTAKDEHFVVDLAAGTYELSCEPLEPEKNLAEKRSISFALGETKYLACSMAPHGVGSMFGLIGALASTYLTKSFLEEHKFDVQSSKLVGYVRF